MNFRTTLQQLVRAFGDEGIGYALIGGYAVGLWGVARGTVDIDFLVSRDDLPRLDRIMIHCGFSLLYRSDNVSQFHSPGGGVDFLHAFRHHSVAMLGRAAERSLFEGEIVVRVLRPDDLIGLKIQAIANDPQRTALDRYDIEELLRLHGATLDWQLVEEYFDLFGMHDLFAELKSKYAPHR
jgi:hypothetical protein